MAGFWNSEANSIRFLRFRFQHLFVRAQVHHRLFSNFVSSSRNFSFDEFILRSVRKMGSRSVKELTAPLGVTGHRALRRFHQQKPQQHRSPLEFSSGASRT